LGGVLVKRVLSGILALTLSFTVFFTVKADDLTDAQKEYNSIQKSIKDNKAELNSINKEKAATEKNIKDLDSKMDAAAEVLKGLNEKITSLNGETSNIEKQIKQTIEDLEDQDELFKKRIRALYINGNEGYLEILLSSDSFADFLSSLETLTKIMEHDRNLIESIEKSKNTLVYQKAELERKKGETVVLKTQADNKHKELQESAEKKKEYMEELEKDKEKYEQLIKEEERESAEIASLIKAIQKRKEEERKKQQANGGTITKDSPIGKLYCVTGKPYTITSPFGPRMHPVLKYVRMHSGIDIGTWTGTKLYSLADGEVIYSGSMSGYGNVVMVDHGSITSLYAHLSSSAVKVGQEVKGGQLIAYSGNSGLSSGPHLHFEIRNASGTAINPTSYYIK
jgi:murein DD-endopeptidase MepM/ murein hydrolase activator NlpD